MSVSGEAPGFGFGRLNISVGAVITISEALSTEHRTTIRLGRAREISCRAQNYPLVHMMQY
jgi:hypothetical protein